MAARRRPTRRLPMLTPSLTAGTLPPPSADDDVAGAGLVDQAARLARSLAGGGGSVVLWVQRLRVGRYPGVSEICPRSLSKSE
jgi:hypothetical protein